jgi:hypothetical protein
LIVGEEIAKRFSEADSIDNGRSFKSCIDMRFDHKTPNKKQSIVRSEPRHTHVLNGQMVSVSLANVKLSKFKLKL